jgi:hypothetical protein
MLSFVYELRAAGIPVSVRYLLELHRALQRGLAPDLDRLFLLARLIFVKRVEHYDSFERVFAAFFLGRRGNGALMDGEDLLAGKPFEEWLRAELDSGSLSVDELREFSQEDLLARFWETVLAQQGAHQGGNTWVGTHGRSPYGHSGRAGGGVRVHGDSLHGTAQKVIGRRNYLNYSESRPLARENLRQALAALRNLQRAGPEAELDVDETIARTAKNGGEVELVFCREWRDRLRLVVLLDNGGYSMVPHLELVKTVFGRIRAQFRDLEYFYFHNCVYGAVYRDTARSQAVAWEWLTARGKDSRLVVIGDANMAPAELMASYGSVMFHTSERKPGREWLRELRAAFPVSVWLNPIPRQRWATESSTVRQIGSIFPMEDLTLAGIKNAVECLNHQGKLQGHR